MGRPPAFWRLRHKAIPLQVGPIGPAFVPRSLAWLLGCGIRGQRTAKVVCPCSHLCMSLCAGISEGSLCRHAKQALPDSVMVAPQFLVLLVQVQILVG